MDKNYKAKDFVSSKCRKEMKDTRIAIKRGPCTSNLTMHQMPWIICTLKFLGC
jgi:hypothetical protein